LAHRGVPPARSEARKTANSYTLAGNTAAECQACGYTPTALARGDAADEVLLLEPVQRAQQALAVAVVVRLAAAR
jgi:hypothetical protein